jgi:uncharacterized MAPEG superfamily protein
MTLALWTVLIAGILPVLTVGIAKASARNYDNHHPRQWAQSLTGFQARAYAAHQNHYEFFPLFAVGIIIAEWKAGSSVALDWLALAVLSARLGYTWAYLKDWALARSLAWSLGWFGTVALFAIAARGA